MGFVIEEESVIPAHRAAGARFQILRCMNTTYNPGDRVITKIKGQEVEVSVVKLSIDVEVKAPDGSVWWRAISKVRPVGGAAPTAAPASEQPPVEPASPMPLKQPVVTTAVDAVALSEPQPAEEAPAALSFESMPTPAEAAAPATETPSVERRKKARKRR